jgi:ketosteroid isomerase-like protein
MSQENVEIIRKALEHFDRTGEPDWDQIDSDVEVYDHDIPDAGIYRGHKGYAAWLADWGEAWSDFSIESERSIDAADKVVFLFQITAKGRGSGIQVKRRDAMVFTLRDGKTVRLDYHNNEAEALEAVGLSEQDAHADS